MDKSVKPAARKLIMKLFSSRENVEMNAATAIKVGTLFDISENTIRVTLNRLHSANLLTIVDRGDYRLGESGKLLASEINQWRDAEQQLRDWQNGWLIAQTNTDCKRDKKQQRSNSRALRLLGMEKLANNMYVRPDNFNGGVQQVRQKLFALGLSSEVMVFKGTEFDVSTYRNACGLWHTHLLEKNYVKGIDTLEESLERLNILPLELATKETYEIGDWALHQLVFDPLLPTPLIDTALRTQFRDLVKCYDDIGADIWSKFLQGV